MKKSSFVVIAFAVVISPLFSQPGPISSTGLSLWEVQAGPGRSSEVKAASILFSSFGFRSFQTFTQAEVTYRELLAAGTDVLWIIRNGKETGEVSLSDEAGETLRRFVHEGGTIILANQAATMVYGLGFEKVKPETRPKISKDEGYGRQLGFHAFREHPLFTGLNGGVYVLKPETDTVVYQTGYFGGQMPENGRVIAVDWDYIFLREDASLIIEYTYGKGKVLAIGGYLLFDLPNRNRIHLETFTRNIFRYVSGEFETEKAYYWNTFHREAEDDSERVTARPTGGRTWQLKDHDPGDEAPLHLIRPGRSQGNYWDLAGRRMLLMGTDHGGVDEVWAHPVMSIRDYQLGFCMEPAEDTMIRLSSLTPDIQVTPSRYTRTYDLQGSRLQEMIAVSPGQPVAVIRYDYEGSFPVELDISFQLLFRLMWPYSENVLGEASIKYHKDLRVFMATDSRGEFATVIGFSAHGDGISLKSPEPHGNRAKSGNSSVIEMTSENTGFAVRITRPVSFFVILTSTGAGLRQTLEEYQSILNNPERVFYDADAHSSSLLSSSAMLRSPSRDFNDAWLWALVAADRFLVGTPGIGTSLAAGYATSDKGWDGGHTVSGRPGYGWYFGRDGAWSGFALLHYGAFDQVMLMLETFRKYQDLDGKIFHELSTSGVVHYDAADATPLYIALAGKYLRHSGDTAYIRKSWPYILKAIDFCYSTDTDGDGLIENTNVGHGWVEGGHLFGSHTSLYLASCWAAALDEAGYMAWALQLTGNMEKYRSDSRSVKRKINWDFWWDGNQYFYHGLMKNGCYMEETTIMPAIPLLFGQVNPDKAARVLPVFSANGFSTDWGCRIIQNTEPRFNPRGYHTGSVWPLFTGWAALAEFRNQHYLQGYSHLSANHQIWKHWGLGFMEEVLNGEVFLPSGVCHHQCWSETMSIQPVIEGMLGFQPDALKQRVTLAPWIPMDWEFFKVSNLRIGDHAIEISTERMPASPEGFQTMKYTMTAGQPVQLEVFLQPVLPPGSMVTQIIVNGEPASEWGFRSNSQGWVIPEFGLIMENAAVIEITFYGGLSALPVTHTPKPGETSSGFRLLSTAFSGREYSIQLQGPGMSRQQFRIWAAEPSKWSVDGAEIIKTEGNIMTMETVFPDVEQEFTVKTVVVSR